MFWVRRVNCILDKEISDITINLCSSIYLREALVLGHFHENGFKMPEMSVKHLQFFTVIPRLTFITIIHYFKEKNKQHACFVFF